MLGFSPWTSGYYLYIQGQLTFEALNGTVSTKFTLMVMFTVVFFFSLFPTALGTSRLNDDSYQDSIVMIIFIFRKMIYSHHNPRKMTIALKESLIVQESISR